MANPYADMVELVNRTSKVLNVTWDGIQFNLEPNFDKNGKAIKDVHNFVPRVVVEYAKNQHPLMGSEDSLDVSSFQTLVGVKAKTGQKQKDDISFLEQSNALTRVPMDDYVGPNDKVIIGRGKFRSVEASVPNVSQMGNIGTLTQD